MYRRRPICDEQEEANHWLGRVTSESNNANARICAAKNLSEYRSFVQFHKTRGTKTRLSLWCTLAGLDKDKEKSIWKPDPTTGAAVTVIGVRKSPKVFVFFVFSEAVMFVGRDPTGIPCITAGVQPMAEHLPQVGKWGPRLRH